MSTNEHTVSRLALSQIEDYTDVLLTCITDAIHDMADHVDFTIDDIAIHLGVDLNDYRVDARGIFSRLCEDALAYEGYVGKKTKKKSARRS